MNTVSKGVLIALMSSGLALPMAAYAASDPPPTNAELMKQIDMLSKQIEQLKNQVKANEDKTTQDTKTATDTAKKASDKVDDLKRQVVRDEGKAINNWLTIGGDYRFRVDSLGGTTQPFTDVFATFANAQAALQGDFFSNPTGVSRYFGSMGMSTAAALSALSGFSSAMTGARTFDAAMAFLSNPNNRALVQGLGAFAQYTPAYKPQMDTLFTNRFGLDLHAKATEDVTVTARFLAYKIFGAQDDNAIVNGGPGGAAPFFADRVGVFDGTLGHVPSNSYLDVDRAYATWSNIGDEPIWFSVGRRPSTNGAPSNLRLDNPRPGNGGTPSILVDYAFDGMTIGYAPDIDALPGAYAKICYGRGFQSGFRDEPYPTNTVANTDMLGVAVLPIDTDPLRVWTQWNRGFNIFDAPQMYGTYFGNVGPTVDLGNIDWFGAGAMSTIKHVGVGNLNMFFDAATSITHPNHNVSSQFGFMGLMTGQFFQPEDPTSKMGWGIYTGVRYDLPTNTKLGFEYNHGSKNWITFAPAADDMWTSKVGTRGNVYETYVIQELNYKPISSYFSKAFFRLGVQYYDFQYTGSNDWVGAPMPMSAVAGQLMPMTPLKDAYDVYGTFEVKF